MMPSFVRIARMVSSDLRAPVVPSPGVGAERQVRTERDRLSRSVRSASGGALVTSIASDEHPVAVGPALLIVVSHALREKGVCENDLMKAFGAKTGGRGGGKPHMAQAALEVLCPDDAPSYAPRGCLRGRRR